jgi:hypothetical protein
MLTILSGARRQIFVVFASLLLVDKFNFSIEEIIGLYFLNHLVTIFIAPKISQIIQVFGERNTLIIEYIGLMVVFILYAFVEKALFAGILLIMYSFHFQCQ